MAFSFARFDCESGANKRTAQKNCLIAKQGSVWRSLVPNDGFAWSEESEIEKNCIFVLSARFDTKLEKQTETSGELVCTLVGVWHNQGHLKVGSGVLKFKISLCKISLNLNFLKPWQFLWVFLKIFSLLVSVGSGYHNKEEYPREKCYYCVFRMFIMMYTNGAASRPYSPTHIPRQQPSKQDVLS